MLSSISQLSYNPSFPSHLISHSISALHFSNSIMPSSSLPAVPFLNLFTSFYIFSFFKLSSQCLAQALVYITNLAHFLSLCLYDILSLWLFFQVLPHCLPSFLPSFLPSSHHHGTPNSCHSSSMSPLPHSFSATHSTCIFSLSLFGQAQPLSQHTHHN